MAFALSRKQRKTTVKRAGNSRYYARTVECLITSNVRATSTTQLNLVFTDHQPIISLLNSKKIPESWSDDCNCFKSSWYVSSTDQIRLISRLMLWALLQLLWPPEPGNRWWSNSGWTPNWRRMASNTTVFCRFGGGFRADARGVPQHFLFASLILDHIQIV